MSLILQRMTPACLEQQTDSLLNLPQEILVQILRYLLKSGDKIGTFSARSCKGVCVVPPSFTQDRRDCSCSLVELSSQVLRACKLLFELGTPILYNENVLHVSVAPADNPEVDWVDFSFGDIVLPVMADPWNTREPEDFAMDLYESGYAAVYKISDDTLKQSTWRLVGHLSSLFDIRTIHLDLTYSTTADVYAAFRSLRPYVYCSDVVLKSKYGGPVHDNQNMEKLRQCMLNGCKIARCRSFVLKNDFGSPFEGLSGEQIDSHEDYLGIAELTAIMTSFEPAEDLWDLWTDTYYVSLGKLPRDLSESEIVYPNEVWEAACQGDRKAFSLSQDRFLHRFKDTLDSWVVETFKSLDDHLDKTERIEGMLPHSRTFPKV